MKELPKEFNQKTLRDKAKTTFQIAKMTRESYDTKQLWVRVEDAEADKKQLEIERDRYHDKLGKMALRFDKAECIIADLREENAKLTGQLELADRRNGDLFAKVWKLEGKLEAAKQILNEFSNLYPTQKHVEMDKYIERLKGVLCDASDAGVKP